MEEKSYIKGQLLIRSILEEYRNILETLEDPQILQREEKTHNELNQLRRTAPEAESLQRLSLLFSQLKDCYNNCSAECPFDFKENEPKESTNDTAEAENSAMIKDIERKNDQLKSIINETRQLIWDIDRLKTC